VPLRAHSTLCRLAQRCRTITTAPSAPEASAPKASSSATDDFNFDALIDNIGKAASETSNKGLTFAAMLRKSKFMQLGDFQGRIMTGKIIRRMADDAYIDLGLKFHAVCKVPAVNSELYVRNARVILRLQDPELSERFLGSSRDLTLMEADATLIKLIFSPLAPRAPKKKEDSKEPKESEEPKEEKEETQKNE
ncbi:hypothetical protein PENTCL1PPCAC_26986, partial [Pristionchus entomophagus]